ncbi:MAG: YebC/PmpR family DNA-binding transcriptional regulator [Patescibacteria group bacterium]|jgi:YebC/PmpR family DNA-binding regulatory protein
MSGHSKWSTIKRKKGVRDIVRGKIFTKMANVIAIAAREGGSDPEANFKLRLAIDKARENNVPLENIERAIKKGASGLENNLAEQIIYEAYGPAGIALMIEVITDSRNRTVPELRKILSDHNGRLVENGNVSFLFEKKNVVEVDMSKNNLVEDEMTLFLIDCGALDVTKNDKILKAFFESGDLKKAKECLEKKNVKIEAIESRLEPKNLIDVDENILTQVKSLLLELEEHPDVVNIYSNIKFI